MALSCVGNLLLAQSSWAFSSLSRSLQTLICHYWGPGAIRGLLLLSGPDFLYPGVLHLSSTVVWTAVVHTVHKFVFLWRNCDWRDKWLIYSYIKSLHNLLSVEATICQSLDHSCLSLLQVIGVVSSMVRSAKRSQSRGNVFTIAELASYIRRRVSDFTGQRRQARTENHTEGKVKKKLLNP